MQSDSGCKEVVWVFSTTNSWHITLNIQEVMFVPWSRQIYRNALNFNIHCCTKISAAVEVFYLGTGNALGHLGK